MSEPKVLVREKRPDAPKSMLPPAPEVAWRVIGWLGVVLVAAALSDYALAFYPLGFGSPEWELATIGSVVQGMPLFAIGCAAVLMAAVGLGRRWMLRVTAWSLFVVAALVLVALVVFVTDVPLGIRATQGVNRIGIEKLVVKTLFLGLLFALSYVFAGRLALKHARQA